MLKEIHHRMKNNLHMVVGLLDTQSGFLKSEEAKQAIAESQHRVNAMSMIHQKLYQSENLSATDMPAYIHELVEYLRDSFNSGQRILFKMDIDRIEMDLSHSIPLGLILNEAITNSIKYAFPGNRDGIIMISLKHTGGCHYLLSIADNGTGLPEGFESRKTNSLGMNLMEGLSEDMDGNFIIENNNGTEIRISFVYDHAVTQGLPIPIPEITTNEITGI